MKDILYFNTLEDIKLINMMRVSNGKKHDYSKDYLTFEALEDGTFTFTVPDSVYTVTSVSYSTDGGKNWITTNKPEKLGMTITTPTITKGSKVLWSGDAKSFSFDKDCSKFSSTCNFNVNGNIMSLLYGDDFEDKYKFPEKSNNNFHELFYSSKVISAKNLILPVDTLTEHCYSTMFYDCDLLTEAPELPALTLTTGCYNSMFERCSSLNYIKAMFTTTPSLTYTDNWVAGVAETGTFVKNAKGLWNVTGVHGIPEGWTIKSTVPASEQANDDSSSPFTPPSADAPDPSDTISA